jgi:acetoacetyl-CoA synthetase
LRAQRSTRCSRSAFAGKSAQSPRDVPAKIIQVGDISRKITEIAVRDVVHGRPVKNTEALANSEALALYVDVTELRSDRRSLR